MVIITLTGAILLASIHLWAGRMRFLHVISRSRWLSMAGGASVAYVFLYLLPELQAAHLYVSENISPSLSFIEHHIYNMLFGYLLWHREETNAFNLIFFVVAIGLHFLVNDYGLNEHHEESYARRGRWILASAILLGWLSGYLIRLPELFTFMLMAFIAGGVILNVLKEELPDQRQSRFWAFALGVTIYALLLLAL